MKITIEYDDFRKLMLASSSKNKTLPFNDFVRLSHKLYNAHTRLKRRIDNARK